MTPLRGQRSIQVSPQLGQAPGFAVNFGRNILPTFREASACHGTCLAKTTAASPYSGALAGPP
jgi:hypothetical protein